jgi:hypothetical protein
MLDQGHATRDLGASVLSRWTVNDFDLHTAPHCTRPNALPETNFSSNVVHQDLVVDIQFQLNSFRSAGIDSSVSSIHAMNAAIASGLLNSVHPSREARVRSVPEKFPDINAMCLCLQPFLISPSRKSIPFVPDMFTSEIIRSEQLVSDGQRALSNYM